MSNQEAAVREALFGTEMIDIHQPETPTVNRMLSVYERQWTATAEECEKRAAELEAAAEELRKRASDLYSARSFLDDVKQSVLFEIESRNRALSLALVKPS